MNDQLSPLAAAAAGGERHACYEMGVLHLADCDYQHAREWFLKSASLKSPFGRAALGRCLVMGLGGKRNVNSGVWFLEQAAMDGHPDAQRLLYVGYGYGDHGIPRNPSKAALFGQLARLNGQDLGTGREGEPTISEVDAVAVLHLLADLEASAEWKNPIRAFKMLIQNEVPIVGRRAFDVIVRGAAERGCSEAAATMAEAATHPAVKMYWATKTSEPDVAGFICYPGAEEAWPGEEQDAKLLGVFI